MVQLRTFCVMCAHMKQRKLLIVLKDMLLGFFLRCKNFANLYCLQLCYSILKIEAVFSSQPQVVFYQTAQCYILEDFHNIYCHQNHKRLSG